MGGGSLAVTELVPCDMIPTGVICISHSRVMNIAIVDIQSVYEKEFYESFDPKSTHKDFLKDQWLVEQYGMSYSEYMCYIIDQVIQKPDTTPRLLSQPPKMVNFYAIHSYILISLPPLATSFHLLLPFLCIYRVWSILVTIKSLA